MTSPSLIQQSVVAAPLVSPEASEIAVEKGSPIYNQQQPPQKITLGEATVDESSTDPPQPHLQQPQPQPRSSKSSASSSAASTPEDKDGKSDEGEEEDDDLEDDRGAGASGVSSLSSQLWGPERTVEVSGNIEHGVHSVWSIWYRL